MRWTTVLALVGFLGVGAAAAWVLLQKPERGIERMSFAQLDPNTVTDIEMRGAKPVKLHRDGNLWRLDSGREADPDVVGNCLSAAAGVQSSDVLTRDKGRYAELEVDAEKGQEVILQAGKAPIARFVVGKTLGQGAAVRVGESVYKVTSLFPQSFTHEPQQWLERRLFTKPAADVTRVVARIGNQAAYTLTQQDGNVTLAPPPQSDDMRFDSGAAQALIGGLMALRVQEILDADPGAEKTGLDPQKADTLAIYYKYKDTDAGQTPDATLLFGKEDDKQGVYAKFAGRSDVYLVANGTAGTLRRKRQDLADLRLMAAIDAKDVRELIVQDGAKRLSLGRGGEDKPWLARTAGEAMPKDFNLDQGKVAQRLQQVSQARAMSVAPGVSPSLVMAGKQRVQVRTKDGRLATLQFGTAKDGANVAIGTADKKVYNVSVGLKNSLLGTVPSFQKTAGGDDGMMRLNPSQLQNLPPELRASLQRQMAQRSAAP